MALTSKIASLVRESLDLLTTYRPGTGAYKVFTGTALHGGPLTKLGQLGAGAARRGEPYSTVICLSAARVPLTVLRLLRRRGVRIHVNQNGVYYPLWCPNGYRARNRFLRGLNHVAHHSYFQSHFSEVSFERWVGPLPPSRSVLFNSVDRSRFFPAQGAAAAGDHRAVVFLDFRAFNRELWDHLVPLIRDGVPGFRFVLMGKSGELLEKLRSELPAAEWHVSPDQEEVARVLRECDVALHFVYNDVCPNKVIECLASGVHVICSSAGGTAELLSEGGGQVLRVPEGFEKRSYPGLAEIRAAMQKFRANPGSLKQEAARAGAYFDLAAWLKTMTEARHA